MAKTMTTTVPTLSKRPIYRSLYVQVVIAVIMVLLRVIAGRKPI